MTARFVVGDTRAVTATLPDGSVDFLMTSPPFLALRSYLPADHPDKHLEIGSEATPAAFIDVLLDLSAEWRRILAPHGSIVVELGDSFSGSGGAGGDYDDAGWRAGQARWGGSASRARESRWSHADAMWLAGVIDTEGSIMIHRQGRGDQAPSFRADVSIAMMDREVCDKAAEIAGVGNVNRDGRQVYSWHVAAQQARYVLTNIWPHLLIKKRQALAAIELQRSIEDVKGRGRYSMLNADDLQYREMIREHVCGWNARGEDRGRFITTWEPPLAPRVAHGTEQGTGWPRAKSLTLIPETYRFALVYGVNPHTGQQSPAGRWQVRNVIRWVRPNPPVGALGKKWRPATSELVVACPDDDRRYWDDVATRTEHGENALRYDRRDRANLPPVDGRGDAGLPTAAPLNPAGAPLLDWWKITPTGYPGAHYAVYPPELCEAPIEAMCPRRVCTTCGEPSRREVDVVYEPTDNRIANRTNAAGRFQNGGESHPDSLNRLSRSDHTTGWSTCGCPGTDGIRLDGYHTGQGWRPGVVFDPFAGTFTTGAVATGHGRDAIGIDLDPRNADLALDRVGPLILTVERHAREGAA